MVSLWELDAKGGVDESEKKSKTRVFSLNNFGSIIECPLSMGDIGYINGDDLER